MEERLLKYKLLIDTAFKQAQTRDVNESLLEATTKIPIDKIPVPDRVIISTYILKLLTREQRIYLSKKLIQEQVIGQRTLLSHWSTLTAQSSMIDTGYIAQHLVSLQTQIAGQGMRGKGDDLCDGSEVKSANFLDSLDKNGATAPRWNFTAVTLDIMEQFLNYKAIFLLSIDLDPSNNIRIRIWKIDIQKHTILRNRYIEWMNKLGYPKFSNTAKKPAVNFQLFPPTSGTNETFARHGNGRGNGFSKLQIPLENTAGSELIFSCYVKDGRIEITKF